MGKVIAYKKVSDTMSIGLIETDDNKIFWRCRRMTSGDTDFPRKKFNSLKSFEKFVKTKLK